MVTKPTSAHKYLSKDAKTCILRILQEMDCSQNKLAQILSIRSGQLYFSLDGRVKFSEELAVQIYTALGNRSDLEFLRRYGNKEISEEDKKYFVSTKYISSPKRSLGQLRKLNDYGQNIIRIFMKRQGVSQEELARRVGVAQTTISAWFVGRQAVRLESAINMYDALQKPSELKFLEQYGIGNYTPTIDRYFKNPQELRGTQLDFSPDIFLSPLQPFYTSIDGLFRNSTPQKQRRILSRLEILVTELENEQSQTVT